jgi:hypothetical protein
MKKITLLVLTLYFSFYTYSQCNGSDSGYSYNALNNGFIEEVYKTVFIQSGEFYTVTNILANTYTFSSVLTGNNDYITIRNSSGGIIHQGSSPLPYTFSTGELTDGVIQVHINFDSICSSDTANHTVTLLNKTIEPTTCQEIENPLISYRSNTRVDLYWDPPSLGGTPQSYDWEAVPTGSSQGAGGNPTGNTFTTSLSATGLTPGTLYTFFIRSNCGGSNGSSDWYQTPPITTLTSDPPANDFCDGAILVLEETGKDISTATGIPGTLEGGAGTDVVAESCNGGANARDDVWYSFVAQTSDINIAVEEPPFDAIITLFSGECGALVNLACSDANDNNSLTQTEQLYYDGLTVNQTYYFRVYSQGFLTSTPSFSFKLWSETTTVDGDSDGYSVETDCDDTDENINPGATEICDGLDNNCDGQVDEGFTDTDLDGIADCVDVEECDGLDNDGDGLVDEGFDADSDGVADCYDICGGFDDAVDTDGDGTPDGCDSCPLDFSNDSDDDGVCDSDDICSGFDDTVDTDNDGVPDGCDICEGFDDAVDTDGDGTPDGCDSCPLDFSNDSDGDGVCDSDDICSGFDDTVDTDNDGVPDGCDICEGFDDAVDTDGDGTPDGCDSLGINDFQFTNFRIEPNPFRDNILINLPINYNNESFNIYIFDLNGRTIIKHFDIQSQNGIIEVNDLQNLQNGLYFLKVNALNLNESITKRIIKY